MTTEIKVQAFCGPTKEVVIIQYNSENDIVEYILDNGENKILYVYDTKSVEVFEREKC